jgi:hypothetical protein
VREKCERLDRAHVHAETMSNLVILIGTVLVALRVVWPLIRIAINLLAKLVALAFLIAVTINLFVALLSHGRFI